MAQSLPRAWIGMSFVCRIAPMSALRLAPTSFGQQRLWFLDRLNPRNSLYNTHYVMPLPGAVDVDALQRALNEIIRRHEILRTTFRSEAGKPVQVIHPPFDYSLPVVDLSDKTEEARAKEHRRVLDDELQREFDIERGPILSFVLLRLETRHHILSVCVHHISFDDWSFGIFTRELTICYEDFKVGRRSSLLPVPYQYAGFGAEEAARFDRDRLDPQLAYWRGRLRDLPLSTELPTDRPRGPVQTFPGAVRDFPIDDEAARGMRELTRGADATLFMSLFAAFAVLIHRYSGQGDLAVGTPVANRNRPDLANMIGFFVNTLVLRIDLSDDPTFIELLSRARDMAVGALANQNVPFELLVEELRPGRDASRQALFQTMFLLRYGTLEPDEMVAKDAASSGSKFDLTLTVTDAAPRIGGSFEYNTDLFDRSTIARMGTHFATLVQSIVADPKRRVSEFELLDAVERRQIVETWNATASDIPALCVHQIIDSLAAAQPEAPAVCFEGTTLSYRELAQGSERLARILRRRGVSPDARVGLCFDRSPAWIIAMLGTLKAGGVMVPLDPALPADRLAFMMQDAGVALTLTQGPHEAKLAESSADLLRFDEAMALDGGEPFLDCSNPGNLAYVIFTSGSTGRPKGVLVEHGGLVNLAFGQGRPWNVGPKSRVLQFASIGFDATMSEIFSTLCLGGALHLAAKDDLMPGTPLLVTLREKRITHVTLPPSALAAMQPDGLPDLAVVISAGEACEPGLARRWAQGRRLFNAYGPTEITVCATMHEFAGMTEDVPIGRPIGNMQVYVLDRHGAPVPPGVAGEIHVGGAGVARGYLDRPDLTAEKFVVDPFSDRPGARLYRTGDLGRFDASGTLHYLGRLDAQLKIRGYRIEPGEVESVLRLHPGVRDALVLGYGNGPDARLVAYVIPGDPAPLVIELRSFVARRLPEYMTPAAYVTLEAWPKTANGKIDRKALPRPDGLARDLDTAFVAPGSELENTIAAVWRECLGVAQVGANDNFFDLGGHSLLLVRVHDQLKDKLPVGPSLVDLFRFPTVKLQAEMIEAKMSSVTERESVPLGRADQRAARQNAARLQRRPRTGADRHA